MMFDKTEIDENGDEVLGICEHCNALIYTISDQKFHEEKECIGADDRFEEENAH